MSDGRIGRPTEIRYRSGTFYRDSGMSLDSVRDQLEQGAYIGFGPFGRNLRTQAEAAGNLARVTRPTGIVRAVRERSAEIGLPVEFYDVDWSRVTVPRGDDDRIERAGEAFRSAADELVVLGNTVWMRCPEPMIRLDLTSPPP